MMQPLIQPEGLEERKFHSGGSTARHEDNTQRSAALIFLTADHWPLTTFFEKAA
jgi:hypothetical protein